MKLVLKLLQERYLPSCSRLGSYCSAKTSSASFCSPLFTIFKAWKKKSLKQTQREQRGLHLESLYNLLTIFPLKTTEMKHPEEASHWNGA